MIPPLLDDLIALHIDEERLREQRRSRLIREATRCRRIPALVRAGTTLVRLGSCLQRTAAPCEAGRARTTGEVGVFAPAIAPVVSR